jgi:hypothetical protein
VLKAATTTRSSTLTSTVGPDGLAGDLQPAAGGEATFESEVTFTGEQNFQEVGTIAFGDGHRLRFSTVGSGFLGASALITSNFFVGANLEITDHHFGAIFVR